MRTLGLTPCYLILPLCMAGCAATTAVAPKTIASVGDRPLPVVTGEPGSTVAADLPTPTRNPRRYARISGRVYDDRGEPIPDARVRLAVGNAPGGKMISATTDRTGAFTLNGVRPGSSYTVIAEWEDDDGPVTGRSVVEAPDTNVRITLGVSSRDSQGTATARGRKRVSPISERDAPAQDEDDTFAEEPSGVPRVNEEDLPPATEAEALAPPRQSRAATSSSRNQSPRIARWRSAGDGPPTATPRRAANRDAGSDFPAPKDPETRGTSPFATPGAEAADDDGENPLPPALEKGQTLRSPAPLTDDAVVSAEDLATPDARPASLASLPAAVDSDPFETAQESAVKDRIPPPRGAVAAAADRSFDPPAPAETAEAPAPGALVASPAVSDQSVFETESDQPVVGPFQPASPPETRKRPTWKDLASKSGKSPVHAARVVAPMAYPPGAPPAANVASRPGPSVPRAAPTAPPPVDGGLAFCDYDAKLRRIKEFRLPDLEGRPVRFQDIDADLVLLDFWGTWCQPCLRSIPHLVELQKRLGPEKLKVIGVACEQGPVAERSQKVAQQVRRLGINYPVVMSGMEGPCPLQQALKIEAYPTLILVDRQGRIVWRDQGTTPVTLARLDRFLAMSTKDEGVKRY